MTSFFHHKMFKTRGMLFAHLDLQLTSQLEPVEGSTYKAGVKGLSEQEVDVLNE